MGYIKFKKEVSASGGAADLLPAEGILHVGTPNATTVVITYASAKAAGDVATVTYDTQSDFSTIRDAINNAIELANGASGPAITVDMVDITSIAIT